MNVRKMCSRKTCKKAQFLSTHLYQITKGQKSCIGVTFLRQRASQMPLSPGENRHTQGKRLLVAKAQRGDWSTQ